MKRLFLLPVIHIVLLCSLMSYSGCPVVPVSPQPADTPAGDDRFEEAAELFEEGPPGEVSFQTNDTRYWSPVGYTLWGLSGSEVPQFETREVTCSKISGHDIAGFGILICHYESDDPAVGETMLVIMINTLAEYTIGEVTGGRFVALSPWKESDALVRGYNQANTLRVTQGGELFSLYLNGQLETTFRDEEAPLHSGGRNGYIVVISPMDTFPQESVSVLFRE